MTKIATDLEFVRLPDAYQIMQDRRDKGRDRGKHKQKLKRKRANTVEVKA